MTPRPALQTVTALALVVALMSAAVWLQQVRETRYPSSLVTDETLHLTSGAAIGRLTVAYQTLAADLYWIRAVQHFGWTRRQIFTPEHPAGVAAQALKAPYALLYPLLDLTTTLDPLFNIAYRFGAIFLAEAYPGGPGRPDLAIALLEKGLRERPDKWEYMQDIGFVHYWWRHDYRAASEWFRRAGDVPGAPWWLKSLAATTLTEGGDRQSSRVMWEAIRQSAEIDWLRRDAERRLTQLTAMDQVDELQRQVDRVAARVGAPSTGWRPLIQAGMLRDIPVDPSGTPYEINAAGRVRLSRNSPLFPLPDEPQRMVAPIS